MSKTVEISSFAQLSELLKSSDIVVADFYAEWCGPCKQMSPIFEQLSAKLSHPNKITFVKINADSQIEITSKYDVLSLPTFIVFRMGKPIEKVEGNDGQKLQSVVRNLTAIATGLGSSSNSTAGPWRSGELPKGYNDVSDQIDIKGVELLNADVQFGGVRVLFDSSKPSALDAKGKASNDENGKDWVESDTDEQLMLFMPFQSTLKIHTLQMISIPPSSADGGDDDEVPMRPKTIRIYTNRPHILGFDEAEDVQPTQIITLAIKDWDSAGTTTIPLRFVKFQNVTSLVIFIVDGNGSSERVRVDRLRIIGEAGEKRDPGKLEKVGHDHD